MGTPRDPVEAARVAAAHRIAHRVALAGAVLWWLYAFFSTGLFTALSGTGLAVYLLGLPACYVLLYLGVRGVAWLAGTAFRGRG